MADEKTDASKPGPASNFAPVEISLDAKEPVDWAAAMAELEAMESKPAPRKPAPAPAPAEQPAAPAEAEAAPATDGAAAPAAPEKPRLDPRERIRELSRKPAVAMKNDDLDVIDQLSEILSHVNSAMNRLKKFERDHPALIAPNVLRVWEDNLRETSTMMLREFHALRHGKENKVYDESHVCKECHTVFMVPLPADRLCDECRARLAPRSSKY